MNIKVKLFLPLCVLRASMPPCEIIKGTAYGKEKT